MSNVQELEMAVSQLPANELRQFSEWFEEFLADQWIKKLRLILCPVVWMQSVSVRMMNFSLLRKSTLNHFATPEFWFHYRQLPDEIRTLADKNFELLRINPRHLLTLEKDRCFLVGSCRITLSVVSKRATRRSRVVLDWFT